MQDPVLGLNIVVFGFLEVALHLVLLCNVLVGIIQELLGQVHAQISQSPLF